MIFVSGFIIFNTIVIPANENGVSTPSGATLKIEMVTSGSAAPRGMMMCVDNYTFPTVSFIDTLASVTGADILASIIGVDTLASVTGAAPSPRVEP